MKVLLIHNFYQFWGGEDTYVTSLQKLLSQYGHDVIVYSKDSKNIKTIWDKAVVTIGLFWNPRVSKELNKLIQREKPDIAHFNNIYPLIGATAYYTCKKNGLKIVQTIHNYRFICPKGTLFRDEKICELCVNKRFFSPAIRFGCYHGSRLATLFYTLAFFIHKSLKTFSFIDTFIFPSQFTQAYYERHFGIPKSKSVHLPYFVDIKAPEKKTKKENWYLYVGRLSEEKGILHLLEVFKNMPQSTLKIIGRGPLENEVNAYKKYKNIHVLGHIHRAKLAPYYQKARAVIIPSIWYEVLPLTALEALASRSPLLLNGDFANRWKKENMIFNNFRNIILNKWRFLLYQPRKISEAEILTSEYHCKKILSVYSDLI